MYHLLQLMSGIHGDAVYTSSLNWYSNNEISYIITKIGALIWLLFFCYMSSIYFFLKSLIM